MPEQDLEKLLGGFTADTLTPEEKQTLYTAALQDQQLFNALADEQALKELLSDPNVRRKLLASLEQKNTSRAVGSLPWLDWFRRPAGLAFAGGLSAAALAVVLGIRIYQDGLEQAAQSVRTEEIAPTTPQTVEPQTKTKENLAPSIDHPKKDTSTDKLVKREQSAPPPSKNERASDAFRDNLKQRPEQDEVRREAEPPVTTRSKSAEEVTSSAAQSLAASSAPPATVPESKQIEMPDGARIAATATPALRARALFYEGESGSADVRLMAKEREQAPTPLAESAPQANRPERPLEKISQLGKTAGAAAQLKPLGLRYSFVVRRTDGRENEVDAASVPKSIEPVFLTAEANQEAYLQVWKIVGSSIPQLLWPEKESGQVSLKMTAGQRQQIPLPMENKPVTLMARLSRVPPEPTMKQEAVMYDRLSSNQLQESISASNRTGTQERATYVVGQGSSATAQIVIEIPLGE